MAEACANPLLLGWIKEWLDQARELNSKGVTVYVFKCCLLRTETDRLEATRERTIQ
jgi:crossover junction endonuclease MUS81